MSLRTLFFVIANTLFCHCEHSFLSLRTLFFVIANTLFCHCEHSFLSLRTLFFVIANTLFCHSERSEESSAWMLCFAQHDKLVDACALFSMTDRCHSEHSFLSLRTLFFVIPNAVRNPVRGCFASLSMTNWWMLCFAQHDKLVDACALFSMTDRCHSEHSFCHSEHSFLSFRTQ
jgi:hypothetical protein